VPALGKETLLAGALVLLAGLLPPSAARRARPALLDIGPNDRGYLHGFRSDWERQDNWQFRWTTRSARVELPLLARGQGSVLRLRLARHLIEPAEVRLQVEGRVAHAFEIFADRKALYRVVEAPLPALAGRHRFALTIEAHSTSPRPLGVALDWIELDRGSSGATFALVPETRWRLLALALLAFLAPRLLGASRRGAALHSSLVTLLVTWATWRDIVATERVLREGLPAYALFAIALVLVLAPRRARQALGIPSPAYAAACCCLALLAVTIRLGILLHPQFFYPDVHIHGLFAHSLAKQGLQTFLAEFTANQFRYSLGLQFENGHWYAFPYPPTFYFLTLPFTRWLGSHADVAVSLVAAIVNGLQVLVVFALARRLGRDAKASLAAAAVVLLLPVFIGRLTLALFPALLGQTVDALVLLFLLGHLDRLDRPRTVLALAGLITAALLTYTQSLLGLGLVLPGFLALQVLGDRSPRARRRQLGLLLAGLLAGGAALAAFYAQYVPLLLDIQQGVPMPEEQIVLEIFERRDALEPPVPEPPNDPFAGPGINPLRGLMKAGSRLLIFYGPFSLAVLLGIGLLYAGVAGAERRLLLAWSLSFVVLNLASAGLPSPNLVRHAKDVELIAPLCAIAIAVVFTWLLPRRRALAWLYALGFLGYGVTRMVALAAERFTLVR
jgi:hypothetical protein